MKRHIPNFITLTNLFLGCLAILGILAGQHIEVFWLTLIAGFLDVGDGGVARLLNVRSDIGKELDSLADMVTFGVVPGVVMFFLLKAEFCPDVVGLSRSCWIPYIGFLVPVTAAYRLAKFNIDTRQSDRFLGVPTPANTTFFIGLYMVYQANVLGLQTVISANAWILIVFTIVCSYLLIAEIPMFSFKMKKSGWKGNEIQYSFLVVALILWGLLVFTPLSWLAIPVGSVLYVLFSLVGNFLNKKNQLDFPKNNKH